MSWWMFHIAQPGLISGQGRVWASRQMRWLVHASDLFFVPLAGDVLVFD